MATLPKVTLLPGYFSCFLNCTSGTKPDKHHMYMYIYDLLTELSISNNIMVIIMQILNI